jgi:hypothetical protein
MPELIIDVHGVFGATPASPHWGDPQAIRADLQARGIKGCFLASDLAVRFDPIAGNAALADVLAPPLPTKTADLRGWLVLHPDRSEDANAHLRKHLYSGDRFVGAALYCDPLTGVPVSLTRAQEVINAFRRFSRPLLIQTNTAEAMREATRIATDLGNASKVIASGMGGDEWREAIDLAVKPLNLFLDISGTLTPDKVEYAMATLGGARRLLFGSGAPATDPVAVLGMLGDIPNLSSEDRERILSGNALRLFDPACLAAITQEHDITLMAGGPDGGSSPSRLRPL